MHSNAENSNYFDTYIRKWRYPVAGDKSRNFYYSPSTLFAFMFELALRLVLILFCAGAIILSGKVAIWTTKPWWGPILGHPEQIAVTIEPVGMIEGGKVKQLEGLPIASQLNHRLSLIYNAHKKDMGEHYTILAEAGVSIPTLNVGGTESFQLVSDGGVTFEVSVFKFDVAGLMAYVHGKLDARDQIKILIEIRDPQSRLFVDVNRINGEHQRLILDSGPSLNASIDFAACAIAHAYRKSNLLFQGLDAHGFCYFQAIFEDFQDYIVQTANRVRTGGQISLDEAKTLIDRLESSPLDASGSPVVHLILASLYKLRGNSEIALSNLEAAAERIPDHEFVLANLVSWRKEKAERDADQRELASLRTSSPDGSTLADIYKDIRTQANLSAIRYPEMLDRLKDLPSGAQVQVAVFSTGFTHPIAPVASPKILETINTTSDENSNDLNGHGNMVTHLLAALTPSDSIEIRPFKVLGNSGSGSMSEMLGGFEAAKKSGSIVLSIPLGQQYPDDPQFREAVDKSASDYSNALQGFGLIALAAAGNNGREGQVGIPARLDTVVSVGGSTLDGEWADFSPGPENISVTAPAVDILTTVSGEKLRKVSGTSFSVIVVSALFAIAKSVAPELTQDTILEALKGTSIKGKDSRPDKIDALAFINRIAEQ